MTRKVVFFAFGTVAFVALGAFLVLQRRHADNAPNLPDALVHQEKATKQDPQTSGSAEAPSVVVGGVARPQRDFPSAAASAAAVPASAGDGNADDPESPFDFPDYGKSPAIAVDANVQVAAVAKALQEKNRPELLSPLIAPRKFDPVAYASNPQSYLDSPEPGRVFATAQPGPDVVEIQRQSGYYTPVLQGERVNLRVQAPAGAPVSFTSFDLGLFSNQLTTITVAADDSGVATAEFLASTGTIAKVNVLAGSPVTSGQVKFVVDISLPPAANN